MGDLSQLDLRSLSKFHGLSQNGKKQKLLERLYRHLETLENERCLRAEKTLALDAARPSDDRRFNVFAKLAAQVNHTISEFLEAHDIPALASCNHFLSHLFSLRLFGAVSGLLLKRRQLSLSLGARLNETALVRMFRRVPTMTALSIQSDTLTSRALETLSSVAPNLRELTSDCRELPFLELFWLVQECPRLQSVSVLSCGDAFTVIPDGLSLPQLRQLRLEAIPLNWSGWAIVNAVLQSAPNLEVFQLGDLFFAPANSEMFARLGLHRLQQLRLGRRSSYACCSWEIIDKLLQSAPNLELLLLDKTYYAPKHPEKSPKLATLILDGPEPISLDQALQFRLFTALRTLDVGAKSLSWLNCTKAPVRFESVTELRLRDYPNHPLAQSFPSLRKLVIGPSSTPEQCLSDAITCPRLKELDLTIDACDRLERFSVPPFPGSILSHDTRFVAPFATDLVRKTKLLPRLKHVKISSEGLLKTSCASCARWQESAISESCLYRERSYGARLKFSEPASKKAKNVVRIA